MSNSAAGFTKVPNWLIYNTKLSSEAKYLYVLIISRQNMPKWRWSKGGLSKFVNFGRDKLNRILDELLSNGLIVKQNTKKQGRFSYVYYLPCTENQLMVNEPHINKNINKKDIINNKHKMKDMINSIVNNLSQ